MKPYPIEQARGTHVPRVTLGGHLAQTSPIEKVAYYTLDRLDGVVAPLIA